MWMRQVPKGHRTLRDPRSFVASASGIKMVHRLPESCQLGRFVCRFVLRDQDGAPAAGVVCWGALFVASFSGVKGRAG